MRHEDLYLSQSQLEIFSFEHSRNMFFNFICRSFYIIELLLFVLYTSHISFIGKLKGLNLNMAISYHNVSSLQSFSSL